MLIARPHIAALDAPQILNEVDYSAGWRGREQRVVT
jgi:hypothetical protein